MQRPTGDAVWEELYIPDSTIEDDTEQSAPNILVPTPTVASLQVGMILEYTRIGRKSS
ncbi:MAG: hypothetical protein J07HQW1_00902 [Haloquadratum walsbyi J07HQW1]|uniref:Uncharacterized protein n=1 Tax=Haloquadratum walsbyi J07HQW1 TaxID=1238424 RepID=U1MMC9_9EURY|nr:MAG: hypothetical protein J07HQW1_00902 [Haloquadratum walsbyi J07HQW1]